MGISETLMVGSLKSDDIIKSDTGLVAKITMQHIGYYVVSILEGSPFQSVHKDELRYNQSLSRYEVNATNLRKWKRKD